MLPGTGAVGVEPCPCGSGATYDACCGRLHRREAEASTAEQLMRSRYAGYVVGALDHVFRTWHPRTRPEDVTGGPAWTGLRIVTTDAGGPEDDEGEVEFVASYAGGALHERSRFVRRRGRWVYVDGVIDPD
jgi:SEC-C motif-containing protein